MSVVLASVLFLTSCLVSSFRVEDLYKSTRCTPLSMTEACLAYTRCKETHRCGLGEEDYRISDGTNHFFDRTYVDGDRAPIPLMNDFEDWKTGTHGWRSNSNSKSNPLAPLGFHTEDFPLLGPLELTSGYLEFDTSTGLLSGDVQHSGVPTTSTAGTKVVVFNFESLMLSEHVSVRVRGNRALVILSRSSLMLDTSIIVPPGTLGGFPGGATPSALNINGPGSSSVRVYVKTLQTGGTNVNEIQDVQTSVNPGQTLGGTFRLRFKNDETQDLAADVDERTLKMALETNCRAIGRIRVSLVGLETNPKASRTWRITFLTAVGNVPSLDIAQSRLSGEGAAVGVSTHREGNHISGVFRMSFLGYETRDLATNVSAEVLENVLQQDIPALISVSVTRTDPFNRCTQGSVADLASPSASASSMYAQLYHDWLFPNVKLDSAGEERGVSNRETQVCESGPEAAGGQSWKLELTTREGNVSPTSPTSSEIEMLEAAEVAPLIPISTREEVHVDLGTGQNVSVNVSTLEGVGAYVSVEDALCFSLAYGGTGGSFGGLGGLGYASGQTASPLGYEQANMSDLVGGSGGGSGGHVPLDVLPYVRPIAGGAGGGALLLSARNDLILGPNAHIQVNGGAGEYGIAAAGGGSGGSLVLSSGQSLVHQGRVSANGGPGGQSPASRSTTSAGGGGGGGRVSLYGVSIHVLDSGITEARGGEGPLSNGTRGSVAIQSDFTSGSAMSVDPTVGAAGTAKSLAVKVSGVQRSHGPSDGPTLNGPTYGLPRSTPSRASYFFRLGGLASSRRPLSATTAALFALQDPSSEDEPHATVVGAGIVRGAFCHEANFYTHPRTCVKDKLELDRWYKVDIFIQWHAGRYSIRLNDVEVAHDVPFRGDGISQVGLYNYHPATTWWDEIYIGLDHTLAFRCPEATSSQMLLGKRERKLWRHDIVGPESTLASKSRNLNHLSAREYFKHNNGQINPLDGPAHARYVNDLNLDQTDTFEDEQESISFGELIEVQAGQDTTMARNLETVQEQVAMTTDGSFSHTSPEALHRKTSFYWYSEVYDGPTAGGIGACSTTDFISWRNEGIMIHFANLTDPFGNTLHQTLIAERPKVLYQPETSNFIMWMHIDTRENNMGLSGVASSALPNGPFTLHKSFYPDAPLEAPGGVPMNETHDQTVLVDPESGVAYLIRSYYKTVNYWIPRAVMKPLWESVKDAAGETDFGLSYHRAKFHPGYDDVDDIYIQRWRGEDTPWEIQCCDAGTNACTTHTELPVKGHERVCASGQIKRIIGQGVTPMQSRYKDPNDAANNVFMPNAVPSHTTWGFQVYNVKTWRGNYFDALSTNISQLMFQYYAGQRVRMDVASNGSQYRYPNQFEFETRINVSDTQVMQDLLDHLGVPLSDYMRTKYSLFDLKKLDVNLDGKIQSSEIAALRDDVEVQPDLLERLLADVEVLRQEAVVALDHDTSGFITYREFEAWLGLDPDLTFDRFDLDKSGYLDENELARMLRDRMIPRLDSVMIFLDPDFDGRVYYQRFERWLLQAPAFVFDYYDFDRSDALEEPERAEMFADIGEIFTTTPENLESFEALIDPVTNSIHRSNYTVWFSTTTSIIRNARDEFRIDNAVHGTDPDTLTGPLHVAESRRAKYVGISRLTRDYLSTEGLLSEIEGDFEGHAALVSILSMSGAAPSEQDNNALFNLHPTSDVRNILPYRKILTASDLGHRATYWNGREFEGRPSAPEEVQYDSECHSTSVDTSDFSCPACLSASSYISPVVATYQTTEASLEHCDPSVPMNTYLKDLDQHLSAPLRYQQRARAGSQGQQPHYSPCLNASQWFPCDVRVRWPFETRPQYLDASQKIRASTNQSASTGQTFGERFPNRTRLHGSVIQNQLEPDQLEDVLAGGGL